MGFCLTAEGVQVDPNAGLLLCGQARPPIALQDGSTDLVNGTAVARKTLAGSEPDATNQMDTATRKQFWRGKWPP